MTRESKLFVLSAAAALLSTGLLVVRELGLADSALGRSMVVAVVVLVLGVLALVLWRRP